MPQVTQLGRVMVPVSDQDAAIAFYTSKLGFSLVADLPFGESAGSKSRRPAAGPPSRWCLRAASTRRGA